MDTVINYIDQNEDPENICKLITACPEPQPKLKALPIQFPGQVRNWVKSDKNDVLFLSIIRYNTLIWNVVFLQCKVCNDAVDIMEILLKDFGPAEATIKNAAEEVSHIPCS